MSVSDSTDRRTDADPIEAQAAPDQQQDDAEEQQEEDYLAEPSVLSAWLRESSSWMISAMVHMILVIVLGLLSVGLGDETGAPIILSASADVDNEEIEEAMDDFESDFEVEEAEALPVQNQEMGIAAIGDMAAEAPVNDMGTVAALDAANPMTDLGTLFGAEGQGFADAGAGMGGATFFGVKTGGRRFIFIVDGSKSMNANGWEFCKRELVYTVRRMKPEQYFYVFLFADKPYGMFGPSDAEAQMIKATPENMQRLERWLVNFDLVLGTRPKTSMELAMAMRPDAIYFLTDGQLGDDTAAYLKRENKVEDLYEGMKPKTPVHTFAFFSDAGAETLKKIADENGGIFKYVEKPLGYKAPKKPMGPGQPGTRPNQAPGNKPKKQAGNKKKKT